MWLSTLRMGCGSPALSRWALNIITSDPIREKQRDLTPHREESDGKTKAEVASGLIGE